MLFREGPGGGSALVGDLLRLISRGGTRVGGNNHAGTGTRRRPGVAHLPPGETVGLASAHLLMRVGIVFLVYLAIAPEVRRHGLGTKLFEFMWKSAFDRMGFGGSLAA